MGVKRDIENQINEVLACDPQEPPSHFDELVRLVNRYNMSCALHVH